MEGEFEDEPRIGGHNFAFVDELSPGQTCSICLLAMRSPVQTVCGHRFCESCLLKAFREGGAQVCPQGRCRIPENVGFFRDVAWDREILSLRVKCKRNERGCDWTGLLRHYEQEHFVVCQYEEVTCDDCKGKMQKRLLHEHTRSECPNRTVQCDYYEEELAFCSTKFHEDNECARFPLECRQECGLQIPREEVESHLRDDCMMTMVVCPYQDGGWMYLLFNRGIPCRCPESTFSPPKDKRSNLQHHLEIASKEHLSKTWSELLTTKERFNELKTENETMNVLLDKKSGEMNGLQRKLEEVQFTTSNDQVQIGQLKHIVFTMQFNLEGIEEKLQQPTRKSKGMPKGKFTIRKGKWSRQGQSGTKEKPSRERSGSTTWY